MQSIYMKTQLVNATPNVSLGVALSRAMKRADDRRAYYLLLRALGIVK